MATLPALSANVAAASVQSQLANLANINTPAAAAPLSALALFVNGDIKGGAHAHAFRVATMRNAIEQALKGNADPMKEAAALADGKAKKARAYHAGFAAVQTEVLEGGAPNPAYCMARVQYKGALTLAENKGARELIADKTHHCAIAFFAAFDAVMAVKPVKKVAPVVAPVVAASAPVAAPAPVDAPALALAASAPVDAPEAEGESTYTEVELSVPDAVDTMLTMIKGGMLNTAELALLNAALTACAIDATSDYPTDAVMPTWQYAGFESAEAHRAHAQAKVLSALPAATAANIAAQHAAH